MISLEVMGLWSKFGCECPRSYPIQNCYITKTANPFSKDEMMRLRTKAILRGTSLHRFIQDCGYNYGNSHSALIGRRNGKVAEQIRQLVREEFAI